MRRVVITGLGAVTSLGVGAEANWQALLAARSGITAIDKFDVSDIPAKIAGMIPVGDGSNNNFNADDWVPAKDRRRMDDFMIYGLCAAEQAIADSGWVPKTELPQPRF